MFRNLTNGRITPEGKGLIGALRYYGFDTIGAKQKDAMRDRIMRGWPFTPEEREQILALLRRATTKHCCACYRGCCRSIRS